MQADHVYLSGRVRLIQGDIVRIKADVIVNAANSTLMGGGGVDGAIHAAGGPLILGECQKIRVTRYPSGLPAGEAVVTAAGWLQARYVIHTVGPIWRGGRADESELLGKCYRNSLELAESLGAESILFPSIATGVYGYPKDLAAHAVWKIVGTFVRAHAQPKAIGLVFYTARDLQTFKERSPE
jgi:O-acetyl-ADP-ribose deacetylase (regulator of RNase III)